MIALARHGETAYNAEDRYQGLGAIPLNATGLRQARALAAVVALEPWSALYASPVLRARQTAEEVSRAVGLEPVFDARLAETDTGDWQDRTFADVRKAEPELYAAWRAAGAGWRFPGGESLAEQQQRVLAALADIRATPGALPALVICHRGVIRVALCHERGESLDGFHAIEVANGSLVRFS